MLSMRILRHINSRLTQKHAIVKKFVTVLCSTVTLAQHACGLCR